MKSIYYRSPYQQILSNEIKIPLTDALNKLIKSGSSPLDKARAVYAIVKLIPVFDKLPEPTIENTRQPNTHILIGIRDRFFKRLKLASTRSNILKKLVDFAIVIYDTDFYRAFIDVWVMEIKASDWEPVSPRQPDHHHWKSEEEINETGGKQQ